MTRKSPLLLAVLTLSLVPFAGTARADHRDDVVPVPSNAAYVTQVHDAATQVEAAARHVIEMVRHDRGWRRNRVSLRVLVNLANAADRFENEWERFGGDRYRITDEYDQLLRAHQQASADIAQSRSPHLFADFDQVDAWMNRLNALMQSRAYGDDRDRDRDHDHGQWRQQHDDRQQRDYYRDGRYYYRDGRY